MKIHFILKQGKFFAIDLVFDSQKCDSLFELDDSNEGSANTKLLILLMTFH